MLTFLCVLRSGGDFTTDYVRRLKNGVERHCTLPHRFACLSDVDVPCERIQLVHDWPGWWSKIELFRPDVVDGPTFYLDLDTVIVRNIDRIAEVPYEFAMCDVKQKKDWKLGMSGLMWWRKPQPHVYERFAEKPQHWIDYHKKNVRDRYLGDQAFISDCFGGAPEKLTSYLPRFALSYKWFCINRVPDDVSIVAFGGHPRPHQVKQGWVVEHWR